MSTDALERHNRANMAQWFVEYVRVHAPGWPKWLPSTVTPEGFWRQSDRIVSAAIGRGRTATDVLAAEEHPHFMIPDVWGEAFARTLLTGDVTDCPEGARAWLADHLREGEKVDIVIDPLRGPLLAISGRSRPEVL